MTVVKIPGETVTILRSALQTALGNPATRLDEASVADEKEKRPGLFRAALSELNVLCLMLDALGWCEPDDPSTQEAVTIDFNLVRRLAVDAMRVKLVAEREFITERDEGGEHDCLYERACDDAELIERFIAAHDPTER